MRSRYSLLTCRPKTGGEKDRRTDRESQKEIEGKVEEVISVKETTKFRGLNVSRKVDTPGDVERPFQTETEKVVSPGTGLYNGF